VRSSATRTSAASAARFLGLAAACALAGACHRLLELDEPQCDNDGACLDRGFAAGVRCVDERCRPAEAPPPPTGPWACLGRVEFPRATGAMVPFELQVRDIASNLGLAGANARLCGRNDSACSSSFSPLISDAEGYLAWTVSDNFDGYAEVDLATYARSIYYPQISYIRRGGGRGPYVSLGKPELLQALAQANGASRDPAAGDALLYVVDCDGKPAGGVRFETEAVQPNTLPYYLVNRVPDGSAPETDAVVGGGGFLNLPARLVSFRAFVGATGQTISTVSLIVRPGSVTFAVVEPTP
jgi:hypothetical protein